MATAANEVLAAADLNVIADMGYYSGFAFVAPRDEFPLGTQRRCQACINSERRCSILRDQEDTLYARPPLHPAATLTVAGQQV